MTNPARHFETEITPVDDLRKIRERLNKEAEGDVRKLAKQSAEDFEALKKKLQLQFKEVKEK